MSICITVHSAYYLSKEQQMQRPHLLLLYLIILCSLYTVSITIDHKNDDLSAYLNSIQHNIKEKIGILPYILKNSSGTYLEIGTGGDAIAEIMAHISPDTHNLIIASDIEEDILKALPERHPQLIPFMLAQSGPRLRLLRLNATDMSLFSNNFLDGINASALVHEIISYAGGIDGAASFFRESCRTLKPQGILVYRDPEYVPNPNEPVVMHLLNKHIRLFTHLFLYTFLKQKDSVLESTYTRYTINDVTISFFKPYASYKTTLSYTEYIATPSTIIDFTREHILTLPCGLYREIARHYITYIYQCNPLLFIQCIPHIDDAHYTMHYISHHAKECCAAFFNKHNQIIENDIITHEQKEMLDRETQKITQAIECGVPLSDNHQKLLISLYSQLDAVHAYPDSMLTKNTLDYRVFALLYKELKKTFHELFIDTEIEHALWIQREGKEHYGYFSADALITYVLEHTHMHFFDHNGNLRSYVLCPLSTDHSFFIERTCYSAFLQRSLSLHTLTGHPLPIYDGKRIIHFAKMHIDDALKVCRAMVNSSTEYPLLTAYLHKIQAL